MNRTQPEGHPWAIDYWQEALSLFRSSGNKPSTTQIVLHLSGVARYQGDDQWSERLNDEGLALARELSDAQTLAWALHERGQSALAREKRTHAARLFVEGLYVSQEKRTTLLPAPPETVSRGRSACRLAQGQPLPMRASAPVAPGRRRNVHRTWRGGYGDPPPYVDRRDARTRGASFVVRPSLP